MVDKCVRQIGKVVAAYFEVLSRQWAGSNEKNHDKKKLFLRLSVKLGCWIQAWRIPLCTYVRCRRANFEWKKTAAHRASLLLGWACCLQVHGTFMLKNWRVDLPSSSPVCIYVTMRNFTSQILTVQPGGPRLITLVESVAGVTWGITGTLQLLAPWKLIFYPCA
jgi:hypothetical protein